MGNCLETQTKVVHPALPLSPHGTIEHPGKSVEDVSKSIDHPSKSIEHSSKSSPDKKAHPLPPPPQPVNPPRKLKLPNPKSDGGLSFSPHLKDFSFNELRDATRNFPSENLLGEGGFGYVYKGWLEEDTLTASKTGSGIVVAVKKLKPEGFQGHKEWLSEVTYLGQLHHTNLVKLIGFCSEGENRLLVYEYMPRGSLENHLFRRCVQPLSWRTRIKVAVDAARGLTFLHDSDSQVIYRDFKSSNILLDSEFNAKLSDFGLAKAGPTGNLTHVTTQVIGTEGYTAPEYVATGRLTAKCDVYSFGIVMLELLTGCRALDKKKCDAEQKLLHWVKPHVDDKKKLFRIMDSKLEGRYPRRGAFLVANLALQCTHKEPRYRPHMSEVLSILEKLQQSTKSHSSNPPSSPKEQHHLQESHSPKEAHHMTWSPQGSPLMKSPLGASFHTHMKHPPDQ